MIIDMDEMIRHIEPLPRLFDCVPHVMSMGYMPRKRYWVDFSFQSANFSIVLSGSGKYTTPEGTWEVSGPCVLTQWPEVDFHYGPYETWEELYFCFPMADYPRLLQSGLMSTSRRWWPIANMDAFAHALRRFESLLPDLGKPGVADRLDLDVQRLIMETLLAAGQELSPAERAIKQSKAYLEDSYLESHDFDELALDAGMSPSAFRRHWKKQFSLTPKQFVTQLRIHRARRYLIETRLPIGEIGRLTGFEDQLYFSRKFRQQTGLCPSEYRDQNRTPTAARD